MAEDKNLAKALKAQRRAEKVAAKTTDQADIESTAGQRKHEKSTAQKQSGHANVQTSGGKTHKNETKKPTIDVAMVSTPAVKPTRTIALFSHLDQKATLTTENVPRDIHPAVVSFALQCSAGRVIGSNSRCIAMLRAFQMVISDYTTPQNLQTSLQRHLPTYLSAQISYLVTARPLSISMGSAIRLLKQEISKTDLESSDELNKERLVEFIDTFIRERIEIAGQVIVKAAQERIVDGNVILVYAHSTIVEAILVETFRHVNFKVIVVDSRPRFEGRKMVHNLSLAGIPCTYIMLTAIGYIMDTVDKVLLGAHTVLANGAVYSRAGSALIAMTAHEHHKPVIVACETYKFSDRVQLDAFVTNELGPTSKIDGSLPEELATADLKPGKEVKVSKTPSREASIAKQSQVMKLNLLYDVTPDKYITLCISELGSLPTTAIPFAALSEQNSS